MTASTDLKMTVYASLFVALIAVGAFIAIPIGPVPIVLQNLFVLLAGLLLGPVWGLACVAVYLIIGLAGLPVFAGGTSGLGKLFGPTGGYLLGYLPCVFITASVSKGLGKKTAFDILAMVLGSLIVYAAGVPWLKAVTGMSLEKAVMAGMVPFLIGDALKIVAAAFLAKTLRPLMKL
ncbi:MAG: biotin transporter BioY [Desulfobacula sp.]|nr:biotin transporter BioY [Desulfobacula sp.]MDA8133799.1 biotin transporter BioY [Desulfobacteraceae bacterium]